MSTKRKKERKAVDAFQLLKADHKSVKELFKTFEKTSSDSKRQSAAALALQALRVHAAIEEEIFYPALRSVFKEGDLLDEAQEEHRVAKTLIEDLASGQAEFFEAKFTVLAENVRHHIREEENEMFPRAKKKRLDFDAMGEAMRSRKDQLLADERVLRKAEQASKVQPFQKKR